MSKSFEQWWKAGKFPSPLNNKKPLTPEWYACEGYIAALTKAEEICTNLTGNYANTGLATSYDCVAAIQKELQNE